MSPPRSLDRRRLTGLWLPVVAWAVVIFVASSISHPPDLPGPISDKWVHAAVYGVFALAWVRALAGSRRSRVSAGVAAWAVLAATLYGATDEFHQSFVPGRTPDVRDAVADLAGATAAATAALVFDRLRTRRAR